MQPHRIVSEQEWLDASRNLLAREKEFTRLRDELSRQRRQLPWVQVTKNYLFDGPAGRQTLGQLFNGRRQLVVYHFMFAPGDEQGCPSCSYLADHFDGATPHLAQRDVTLVVASRASMTQINAFRKRMGWKFHWVSAGDSGFNQDHQVSFTPASIAAGRALYNFEPGDGLVADLPGASVFYKDEWGDIFRTYSTYARGLDLLVGTYNFLDLVPLGRNEDGLDFTMSWVRHHDRYETADAQAQSPPFDITDSGISCCATTGATTRTQSA